MAVIPMPDLSAAKSVLLIDLALCLTWHRALTATDFWWSILAAIERGVTRLGHHEYQ